MKPEETGQLGKLQDVTSWMTSCLILADSDEPEVVVFGPNLLITGGGLPLHFRNRLKMFLFEKAHSQSLCSLLF